MGKNKKNRQSWRTDEAVETGDQKSSFFQDYAIYIIIVTVLIVQILGHFVFRWKPFNGVPWNNFMLSWVILRFGLPAIAIYALGIPLSRLGLGRPKMTPGLWKIFGAMLLAGLLVIGGLYFYQGYYSTYSGSFGSGSMDKLTRFARFFVFTVSTLPGYEFLYRSFLLLGLFYILTEVQGVDKKPAEHLVVAIVCVFDVLYHFIKPVPVEPIAYLIGSPIFSYAVLRTGSVWSSLFIHMLVEILFIASLVFR